MLVRAGNLDDDEACKLFRALRVKAVKFGLKLASQPAERRDAKEAADARTALRKRWAGAVEQLGPGYRTARGAEMPDWVAVAHLPSYKVRRLLQKMVRRNPEGADAEPTEDATQLLLSGGRTRPGSSGTVGDASGGPHGRSASAACQHQQPRG